MDSPVGVVGDRRVGYREEMERHRSHRTWIAAGVALSLLAGGMFWATAAFVMSFFCMPVDYAYARQLSSSDWLNLRPEGAEPASAPSADCEDDDRMALGTRTFSMGDLSLAEVHEFYARSLLDHGWELGEGSSTCWSREQGAKRISLDVYTLDSPREYDLQLSSRRDGSGGWC